VRFCVFEEGEKRGQENAVPFLLFWVPGLWLSTGCLTEFSQNFLTIFLG